MYVYRSHYAASSADTDTVYRVADDDFATVGMRACRDMRAPVSR